MEWQPIETAPYTDMFNRVDLYCDKLGVRWMNCFWLGSYGNIKEWISQQYMIEEDGKKWSRNCIVPNPTHWLKLPDDPGRPATPPKAP